MKAKCPYCDKGCEKCQNGMMELCFATGDWFTRECLSPECGFHNGGRICEGFPPESSGACVLCGGETRWLYLGRISDEDSESLGGCRVDLPDPGLD